MISAAPIRKPRRINAFPIGEDRLASTHTETLARESEIPEVRLSDKDHGLMRDPARNEGCR